MRDEIITKKDTLGFLIKIVLFFFKGKILIKSPRTQATKKKQVKMKEGKNEQLLHLNVGDGRMERLKQIK